MAKKSLFSSSGDKRNAGIAALVLTGLAALVGGIATGVAVKKKEEKENWGKKKKS